MCEPATQSAPVYRMSIFVPDSVQMVPIRIQFMGGLPSVNVSTRFGIWIQSKLTSGMVTVPPLIAVPVATPACTMVSSHSPARVPSPGSGKFWVNVHRSTSAYAEPFHTLVVTVVRRLVDQNVGEYRPAQLDPAQS